MSHESGHVIISKLKTFLTKPIPGGGKWWHVVALVAASFVAGAKVF